MRFVMQGGLCVPKWLCVAYCRLKELEEGCVHLGRPSAKGAMCK